MCVILTTGALATGGTDLGQLRGREAGSGFEIAQRSFAEVVAHAIRFDPRVRIVGAHTCESW